MNPEERVGQVGRRVHVPAQRDAVALQVKIQALEGHDVVVLADPKVAGHAVSVQTRAVHDVTRLNVAGSGGDPLRPPRRPGLGRNVAGAAADVYPRLDRVVDQRGHYLAGVWRGE